MVALARTWSQDLNNIIAGATLTAQWQDAQFKLLAILLAAGWTCRSSCDSASAGSNGDGVNRIVASTNIVPNTAGSAHSWIELQSPAGASRTYLVLDWATPAATPRDVVFALSGLTFGTGGTTLARPTSANEVSLAAKQWMSTATVVARRQHAWRDDQGSVVVAGVTDGQGSPYAGFAILKTSFGEAPFTQPWVVYYQVSTSNPGGGFISANTGLFSQANWRGVGVSSAGVSTGIIQCLSPASGMTTWVGGVSNASTAIGDMPMDIVYDSATLGGYLGRIIDVRACGLNTASGTSQAPQDPDSIVRKSCGGLWLPTPTGTTLNF